MYHRSQNRLKSAHRTAQHSTCFTSVEPQPLHVESEEDVLLPLWMDAGPLVVGCDVVTERGTYIGRVRDYEFDPDDGLVQRIVVDALG